MKRFLLLGLFAILLPACAAAPLPAAPTQEPVPAVSPLPGFDPTDPPIGNKRTIRGNMINARLRATNQLFLKLVWHLLEKHPLPHLLAAEHPDRINVVPGRGCVLRV